MATMQNALPHVNAFCVQRAIILRGMETPNQRLKWARERAGFEHAADAARAMDIATTTYQAHENGHRGFPASRAPQYARRFKVSEQWLLYGIGEPAIEGAEVIPFMPHYLRASEHTRRIIDAAVDAIIKADRNDG